MKSNIVLAGIVGVTAVIGATTLPAAAYTDSTLHTFCPPNPKKTCNGGSAPVGLAIDQSGNLFGLTGVGGKHGVGVVFEYSQGVAQYSVLWNFCKKTGCSDGELPGRVSLVIDKQGNLYGTTTKGGIGNDGGNGLVFELFRKNGTWQEKTLYVFCSLADCADGGSPQSGLTYAGAATGQAYDGVSPLYGTTYAGGGGTHVGTVFSVTPQVGTKKWSEQVLYAFCSQTNCTDGQNPEAPLNIDTQGNIYGTTLFGGSNGDGVVYELSPNGSGYTETLPYTFCEQANCADGGRPAGGIVMDTSGNFYGTTEGGGSGQGVLFELSPNGSQWLYSNLADFDGTNGNEPSGTLIIDADGNLFGTTYIGGSRERGNVFEFNGSIQSLYSFCPERKCRDGKLPATGVVQDSAGNLYGIAPEGGDQDSGTLFELSP